MSYSAIDLANSEAAIKAMHDVGQPIYLKRNGTDCPVCPICGNNNALLDDRVCEFNAVERIIDFYWCRDCGQVFRKLDTQTHLVAYESRRVVATNCARVKRPCQGGGYDALYVLDCCRPLP